MGKTDIVRTETVKVATINVERRIQKFAMTLVGCVWNPQNA